MRTDQHKSNGNEGNGDGIDLHVERGPGTRKLEHVNGDGDGWQVKRGPGNEADPRRHHTQQSTMQMAGKWEWQGLVHGTRDAVTRGRVGYTGRVPRTRDANSRT